MATVTATKAARVDALGFIVSKAKNYETRDTAFRTIHVHAYNESLSRSDLIDTLRKALGKMPTVQELDIAKREYVIGRVAGRLPAGKLDHEAREAQARELVTLYAAPAKDGVKARPLAKGMKGRRTPEQHKAIRAAEEAWSQVKAEVAPEQSKAQTQAQRNAAKRGTKSTPPITSTAKAAPAANLAHPELVKAPQEMTPADARAHMVAQASALLSFANKYAGQLPTDFGAAARAFKKAIDKAEALAVSVNA